jgi:hypothetical protein
MRKSPRSKLMRGELRAAPHLHAAIQTPRVATKRPVLQVKPVLGNPFSTSSTEVRRLSG